VADAGEIRDILTADYYIDETVELYNRDATRQNIARAFADLQQKPGANDTLFIYYAGHGHLDAALDAGFWIPVDGGPTNTPRRTTRTGPPSSSSAARRSV
jgi:uncharacterized caspase-like protein